MKEKTFHKKRVGVGTRKPWRSGRQQQKPPEYVHWASLSIIEHQPMQQKNWNFQMSPLGRSTRHAPPASPWWQSPCVPRAASCGCGPLRTWPRQVWSSRNQKWSLQSENLWVWTSNLQLFGGIKDLYTMQTGKSKALGLVVCEVVRGPSKFIL